MWIDPTQEAFFVTVTCVPRGVNQLAKSDVWKELLEAIEFREARGDWNWRVVLAMPDHLHGIVTFEQRFLLTRTIATWKRWLAVRAHISWQDGYFEHRLRGWESAAEKAQYIRMNPVRAGLVADPKAWPFKRDWRA